jgi:hypothetical protein
MIAVVSKESQQLWKAQFDDKNAETIRYFPQVAPAAISRPFSSSR